MEGLHSNLCATDQSAEEGRGRGGGCIHDTDIKEEEEEDNDDDARAHANNVTEDETARIGGNAGGPMDTVWGRLVS